MKYFTCFILSVVLFGGCIEEDADNPWEGVTTEALVPRYVPQLDDYSNIVYGPPRDFENLGNILSIGDRLLIVDFFTGVHLLDNSGPNDPVNVGFVNLPGVHTITYQDSILFCNYGTELILLDISQLPDIRIRSSVEDFYRQESSELYPRNYIGPFECADPTRGIIAGWRPELVEHPKCWF